MRSVLGGKGVLAGAFAGAALVASFGAVQDDGPEVGRYQITATGNAGVRWVYVIDTASGKIWERNGNGDFDRIASPWEK